MLFASVSYFIFLLLYGLCFRLLKPDYRLHLVLVGSLIFYGWSNPVMVFSPAILSVMAYMGVLWIEGEADDQNRRLRLWVVIGAILVPLIYFKYRHFLYNEIIAPLAGVATVDFFGIMPLGISFMTFTLICYVVDVYRKRFPPCRSLFHIFAYVLFFPRLIAGPILRPSELIPQLLRNKASRSSSIGFGLTLFTVGLVKKVIFADSIGDTVDPIFSNPTEHDLMTYWLAMLGYTLQIYCDFSGYTDMAIGSARIFGIRLPLNFNKPYMACNLQDFWRRWHMTLSRWLRDYLYIPLGGNRCSKPRFLSNIIVTMVLCGIWHGAGWTFLIWGLIHGIGLATVSALKFSGRAIRIAAKTPYQIKWFLTFLFLVVSWVFFRAPDLDTAKTILIGAFAGGMIYDEHFFEANAFPIALLGLFALFHRFDSLSNIRFIYCKMNKAVLGILIITVWIISIAVSTASSKSFIYFDF